MSFAYADDSIDTSTWDSVVSSRPESLQIRGYNRRGNSNASTNILHLRQANIPGVALGEVTPTQYIALARRGTEFLDAFQDGNAEAQETADADEADPPNPQIWMSAWNALLPFAGKTPAPLVGPLQLGGVCIEWHEYDLNIELRVRGIGDFYAVVEDARNDVSAFHGRDPTLSKIGEALRVLARRSI